MKIGHILKLIVPLSDKKRDIRLLGNSFYKLKVALSKKSGKKKY
jgi:hypothetical protein